MRRTRSVMAFWGRNKTIEKTSQWLESADMALKKRVLLASVVYPRTKNLKEDTPLHTVTFDGKMDWNVILEEVNKSVELQATSTRSEVYEVVKVLRELDEDLLLSQCDWIQIYKGGVDLLRIAINKEAVANRSVYLELNSARKEYFDLLSIRKQSTFVRWVVIGVATVVVASNFAVDFNFKDGRLSLYSNRSVKPLYESGSTTSSKQ